MGLYVPYQPQASEIIDRWNSFQNMELKRSHPPPRSTQSLIGHFGSYAAVPSKRSSLFTYFLDNEQVEINRAGRPFCKPSLKSQGFALTFLGMMFILSPEANARPAVLPTLWGEV